MLLAAWLGFAIVATLVLIAPTSRATPSWLGPQRNLFAAVFAITLFVGALPTILGRRPSPTVHDEFANLLAADTFAHGRLTNPSPPFADHFATIHELVKPTYASKFPPGTGLVLAVGQLFQLPVLGAFTTIALACGTIAVALRYWLPARWAMLGGLLGGVNTLYFSWGQNFWGGEVAMLGGALLLLGFGRATRRHPDLAAGLCIGGGLSIFAISRPFEGALVSLLLAIATIIACRKRRRIRVLMMRTFPAALIILLPVLCWLGYYNWRVTGNALRLPWNEYARQQMTTPVFFGQTMPSAPHFADAKLQAFHEGDERDEFSRMRSLGYCGRLHEIVTQIVARRLDQDPAWLESHHAIPTPLALMLPLLGFSCFTSSGGRLGTIVFFLLVLLSPALTPWTRPHYFAPADAALLLACTCGLREFVRRMPTPIGPAIVAGFLAAQCVVTTGAIGSSLTPPTFEGQPELLKQLEADPSRKIVLVRYIGRIQREYEWVHNVAALASAQVIFARSIDPRSDRKLLDYFVDREVWTLDVNDVGASIRLGRPGGT